MHTVSAAVQAWHRARQGVCPEPLWKVFLLGGLAVESDTASEAAAVDGQDTAQACEICCGHAPGSNSQAASGSMGTHTLPVLGCTQKGAWRGWWGQGAAASGQASRRLRMGDWHALCGRATGMPSADGRLARTQ